MGLFFNNLQDPQDENRSPDLHHRGVGNKRELRFHPLAWPGQVAGGGSSPISQFSGQAEHPSDPMEPGSPLWVCQDRVATVRADPPAPRPDEPDPWGIVPQLRAPAARFREHSGSVDSRNGKRQ